jgi:hypothetical protein
VTFRLNFLDQKIARKRFSSETGIHKIGSWPKGQPFLHGLVLAGQKMLKFPAVVHLPLE